MTLKYVHPRSSQLLLSLPVGEVSAFTHYENMKSNANAENGVLFGHQGSPKVTDNITI